MDLSKLTELTSRDISGAMNGGCDDYYCDCHVFLVENKDRIVLAEMAFGVMMRRGWTTRLGSEIGNHPTEWHAVSADGKPIWCGNVISWHPDPFTALVEADKWYRENVEAKA